MKHLLLSVLFCVGLSALAFAQKGFVVFEGQVFQHEKSLAVASQSLEEWLSGRLEQKAFLTKISEQKRALGTLPGEAGSKMVKAENQILDAMSSFAKQSQPTSDGQRQLFLSLGRLTQQRSLDYLKWRETELKGLLSNKLTQEQASYVRWEAAWNPIWIEEAKLTLRLQQAMLSESSSPQESKTVLQSLLKLAERGTKISTPTQAKELQQLSTDRLAVLARTSEQLIRLEARQSRSALTQVRRLGKKLTELTEEFQGKRLTLLKKL